MVSRYRPLVPSLFQSVGAPCRPGRWTGRMSRGSTAEYTHVFFFASPFLNLTHSSSSLPRLVVACLSVRLRLRGCRWLPSSDRTCRLRSAFPSHRLRPAGQRARGPRSSGARARRTGTSVQMRDARSATSQVSCGPCCRPSDGQTGALYVRCDHTLIPVLLPSPLHTSTSAEFKNCA